MKISTRNLWSLETKQQENKYSHTGNEVLQCKWADYRNMENGLISNIMLNERARPEKKKKDSVRLNLHKILKQAT